VILVRELIQLFGSRNTLHNIALYKFLILFYTLFYSIEKFIGTLQHVLQFQTSTYILPRDISLRKC